MARCGYTSDTMCECGQSEQTVQHMLQCQLLDKPCSVQDLADATETAMMCVNKRKKPIWGKGNRWWTRQEDHLQLIKFWPTCTPGKGVCSGVVCCTLGEGQPDNYEILWLCKLYTMIDDVHVPACLRACVCVCVCVKVFQRRVSLSNYYILWRRVVQWRSHWTHTVVD